MIREEGEGDPHQIRQRREEGDPSGGVDGGSAVEPVNRNSNFKKTALDSQLVHSLVRWFGSSSVACSLVNRSPHPFARQLSHLFT